MADQYAGFDPFDYDALPDVFRRWDTDASPYKTKELRRVESGRIFVAADEYKLVNDRSLDGVKLQLKEAKKKIDRYLAAVTQYPFDIQVVADELAFIPPDHPFSQFLQRFAQLIAVNSQENAAIVGEMISIAVRSLLEALNLAEKLERQIEWALSDGACYLKDGLDETAPDIVTLDVVPCTDIKHDPNKYHASEFTWWMHQVGMGYERALRFIPDLPRHLGKDPSGRLRPNTAAKNSGTDDYRVEEVWFLHEGRWYRNFWCNGFVGETVLEPLPHKRHPFHQLVGVSNVQNADGMSLALDILYDVCVAKNKTLTSAVHNLETTAANKRLINPSAVENPAQLADSSSSNVVLREGKSFQDAVLPMPGMDISSAFGQVKMMLDAELEDIADEQSGEPEKVGLVPKLGRVDLLKGRVKRMLAGLTYNLAHLVPLIDREKNFRLMGSLPGVPSFVQMNPAILQDCLFNFHLRLSVVVDDQERFSGDPEKNNALRDVALRSAREARETTGLPLSALLSGYQFPKKNEFVRAIWLQEQAQQRAIAEAKARGEPDPATKEILAQAEKERRGARAEVTKNNLRKLGDANPMLGLALETSGISDRIMRIDDMGPADLAELAGLIEAFMAGVAPDPTLVILHKSVLLNLRQMQLKQQRMQLAQAQPPLDVTPARQALPAPENQGGDIYGLGL